MLTLSSMELLRQLRIRGTLTGAAEALSLSKSAASHRLALLEREAGVPITERIGRKLRLTAVGAELAECAERVMHELEVADSIVQSSKQNPAGRVVIGLFHAAAIRIMPRVLRRLEAEYPEIFLESTHVPTDTALAAVKSGDLDLAIIGSYHYKPVAFDAQLHVERLYNEPLYLGLPPGHRLAAVERAVDVSELVDERWVAGETFDQIIPELCAREGFVPHVAHRSVDYVVITLLVSSGSGISIVPDLTELVSGERIVLKKFASPGIGREVVIAVRHSSRGRSAVAAVLRLIRQSFTAP
jgi:DNA-binding transcriptional LysR family regulator